MTALADLSRPTHDGSPSIVSAAPEMLLGATAFAARTIMQVSHCTAVF